MISNAQKENQIAVVFYEFISGTFELFIGIFMLLFFDEISEVYNNLILSGALSETHETLSHLAENYFPFLFNHHLAIGFFVLIIGSLKIISSLGIYFQKKWGHIFLTATLLSLLPYDIYELVINPSISKAFFLFTNVLIISILLHFKYGNFYKIYVKNFVKVIADKLQSN